MHFLFCYCYDLHFPQGLVKFIFIGQIIMYAYLLNNEKIINYNFISRFFIIK